MAQYERCKTRYPVLLLHGLNCRDEKPIVYFGRIPDALRSEGARVYLGGQDSWGTIEHNAQRIRDRIDCILSAEKCEKVNIIAHSKGGLEARYLAAVLQQHRKIASISTISTPHRGSETAAKWAPYTGLLHVVGGVLNAYWRLLGDQNPDFAAVITGLTPAALARFNDAVPDCPTVFYQSWGTVLHHGRDDFHMGALRRYFYLFDGDNDGLVATTSAPWGCFRGLLENVSHQDVVDCRKKNLKHFDTVEFYRQLVQELMEKGF